MKKLIQIKKAILSLSLLLILSVAFSGCKQIYMYAFGIGNPQIENKQSITDYAMAEGMATDNLYSFRDTATQSGFFHSKIGTPEIRYFNKDGYLMEYSDNQKCNAQNDSLLSFLEPENVSKSAILQNSGHSIFTYLNPKKAITLDTTQNINKYLAQLRTLDNEELNKNDFDGYDFYIVIYWAKYVGMANKTHVPGWEKIIKNKMGIKLKVLVVTADYMDYWHPDKEHLLKIYNQTWASNKH